MRLNSVNNTNYIKSTDTASILEVFATDYNGKPVDLTIYKSVDVVVGDEKGRLATIKPIEITKDGYCSFKFDESNALPSGRYFLELILIVNDNSNNKKIAPSKGTFTLMVTDSIDEITSNKVNVINLQALLQMVENSRNYALSSNNYAERIYTIIDNSLPTRINKDDIEYPLEYYVHTLDEWRPVYGKVPKVLDMGTF